MEGVLGEGAQPVEKWEVYHLFTNYTRPPKEKFVVIVIAGAEVYGFFINSRITQYVQNNVDLLPCMAAVQVDDHPFLRYDSYLDCRQAYYFTEPELWGNYRGSLSAVAIEEAKTAIRSCRVLRQYEKIRILGD